MELEHKVKSNNVDEQKDFDYFYDKILSFPDEKQNYRWAVSWSDLMMTMFIFFAVMFIYQVGDQDIKFRLGPTKISLSEQGSGEVINSNIQEKPLDIFNQTKQAINEIIVDEKNTVDIQNDNAVRIILAGDFLFDSGKANLKIGARYQLDQIARVLNENAYMINVAGHTDDTPSSSTTYPTNWELSSQRAVIVARYLTEVSNVDQNRVFITGYSYHEPVRPNDTAYNRSLNRRVELILTKQKY